MKVKESQNLTYTKIPFGYLASLETAEPDKCILESFSRQDDKLELKFKNGAHAFIDARNPQGGLEIDRLEERVKDFIGKSYEEILNINL